MARQGVHRSVRLQLIAAALSLGVWNVADAATFTVDSTADAADAAPGDGACATSGGACTLRAAIQEANALGGANTINVPAGTYTLTIAGAGEDAAATGDLDITGGTLTINGADAAATIVDGNGLDRVFEVLAPASASIAGLTITKGRPDPSDSSAGAGGGLMTSGSLRITNSVVAANTAVAGGGIGSLGGSVAAANTTVHGNTASPSPEAAGTGGGIFSFDGTVTLTNSTVSGNTAIDGGGGGIWSQGDTMTLTDSTVSSNKAIGAGAGGIASIGSVEGTSAPLNVNGSTISDNVADGPGGGLVTGPFRGSATLRNTTISGNKAGDSSGGGIAHISTEGPGTLRLNNVTITNNEADGGGGIFKTFSGSIEIRNTILAGNTARMGADCAATLTSQGYNLIQDTAGCTIVGDTTGNVIGRRTKLGPLADNGGPTQTEAVLPRSPALDAGNPAPPGSGGNACEATDQRGVTRPQGPVCDMGAYERRSGARP